MLFPSISGKRRAPLVQLVLGRVDLLGVEYGRVFCEAELMLFASFSGKRRELL
jgi:hypothetical protein